MTYRDQFDKRLATMRGLRISHHYIPLALFLLVAVGVVSLIYYFFASRPRDARYEYTYLDTPVPSEEIVETTRPIPGAGVERAQDRRKEHLVPKDTKVLSKGCPVTCSDMNPIIGDLSMITDGEVGSTFGKFVEYEKGRQWLTLDLLGEFDIVAIGVWRQGTNGHVVVSDMTISVSPRSDFKGEVACVFNNNPSHVENSIRLSPPYEESRFGKIVILPNPIKARYVRIDTDSEGATIMSEIMVFGMRR